MMLSYQAIKPQVKIGFAALLLCASASTVKADGFYAGLGYVDAELSGGGEAAAYIYCRQYTTCQSLDGQSYGTRGSSIENESNGYKLFLGYEFNRFFSLELSHIDDLKFKSSAYELNAISRSIQSSSELQGQTLMAVLSVPALEWISVDARLGVFGSQAEATVVETRRGPGTDDSQAYRFRDDSVEFVYGVSARFQITDSIFTSVEWTRFDDLQFGDEIKETDVELISLSFGYRI